MPAARRVRIGLVTALFVAHGVSGFLWPRVPAWRMFYRADRYEAHLVDAHGVELSLADLAPDGGWLLTVGLVPDVVRWFARRYPERAPVTGTVTLETPEGPRELELVVLPGGVIERWDFKDPAPTGRSSSTSKASDSSSAAS